MSAGPTIHASAVLAGARALLIRGPAGSGKSRLVLNLLQAAACGQLVFARLVADDRVHVEAVNGRVIARPAAALAGLLEVRGLDILRLPYEPMAVISCVIDLDVAAAPRLPDPEASQTGIAGLKLPQLAIPPGCDPLPLVLAAARYRTPSRTPGTSPPASLDHGANVTAPAHVAL